MKKMYLILLVLVVGSVGAQEKKEESQTKIAVATYDGRSSEGYYFTNDLDESSMLFAKVRPEIMKVYDLKNRTYIRETFRITYNVGKMSGKKQFTIIRLELLDYNDEEDME